jgi:hypothetical protein
MSAAFVMFLIGTVFVVGSALLIAINRVGDLLDERLPKPPLAPGEEARPLRHRITDWSAWRREHAAAKSDASPPPPATESGAGEHRGSRAARERRDRP